jgi:hypothetical protein
MIILFRGLCQEAGLLAGGPPETRTRQRTGAATKPSSSRTNEKKGRLNGTSRGASQPHEASRDDVPLAVHLPTGTASGSVKTIRLRKGESLTLSYSGDMFHIDKKDRELVNRLIDAMDGHEQEIPNGDMY